MLSTFNHIALYISAGENVNDLVQNIMQGKAFAFADGLQQKQGALFSTLAIRQLVNEELLHEHFDVVTANGHSLATSSSGEQRKALLQFIVAQKPAYIVIDNVFESIDVAGQQNIIVTLEQLALHTFIIQILYRKDDCLSFIDTVLTIQNGQVTAQQSKDAFLTTLIPAHTFNGNIPASYGVFEPAAAILVAMINVSVQFDEKPILTNINWQINRGEFWQLIGPNGSGKSTLLSMIIGDNVKGYGQELYLFGKKKGSGETVWDIKQQIGYFNTAVTGEFPRQDSIEKMILSGFMDSIGLYIQPTDVQIALAQQWLHLLGLYDHRYKAFRSFTLAQQRMILIARAMVKHPPLLILDEPTAGLDDENALLFTALVNKIAAETATAILYVSHRREQGLEPGKIYELKPSVNGSEGYVLR
jgi:molybdate transport system ATP-binding protein